MGLFYCYNQSMIIPKGFAAVTPYFVVIDPVAYVEFLVKAFNAKELSRTERDGVIINIIFAINGARLFVGRASDFNKATKATYYLYVEDTDLSMQQAIAAGAEQILEVMDMEYGDRQGGVKDPFGNIWWISQRLSEKDYD